eukprot:214225-Chlamydomonas_euryale.AAC.1
MDAPQRAYHPITPLMRVLGTDVPDRPLASTSLLSAHTWSVHVDSPTFKFKVTAAGCLRSGK